MVGGQPKYVRWLSPLIFYNDRWFFHARPSIGQESPSNMWKRVGQANGNMLSVTGKRLLYIYQDSRGFVSRGWGKTYVNCFQFVCGDKVSLKE